MKTPKPERFVRTTVRCQESQYKFVKEYAKKNNMRVGEAIRSMITHFQKKAR